jgi:hypothetical protein
MEEDGRPLKRLIKRPKQLYRGLTRYVLLLLVVVVVVVETRDIAINAES